MTAINLNSRRELFVDSHILDTQDGTFLKLHEPIPMETVLKADSPWDYPCNFGNQVIFFNDTYLMYYRAKKGEKNFLCIATSTDGIHFTKPALQKEGTNYILSDNEDDNNNEFVPHVFFDERPGIPKEERIKAFVPIALSGERHTATYDPRGGKRLVFYTCPDGFSLKKMNPQPELISHIQNSFDGGCSLSWSEAEQAYVFYYRLSYMQANHIRRAVARMTSKDFYTWDEPVIMSHSNTPEQFYINNTFPYARAPHIYIGLAARFMEGKRVLTPEQAEEAGTIHLHYENPEGVFDTITYNDCSDAVLLSTRAGSTVYDRTFMEAYVRPGIGYGNWASRCNYPLSGIHPYDENTMMFYVNRRYFQSAWHVQRMILRTDGFASLTAPWKGGEALTKPFIFEGSELELNYRTSAAGYIQVELTDKDGNILPGFEAETCEPIVGDEIKRIVRWCSGFELAAYAGKEVRLRFKMKDADLFSFKFNTTT